MAKFETTQENKKRKKAFYKRKGFWGWLFLLGVVFGLVGGLGGYIYLEEYTRPYRERAAKFDLEKINDLELPSLIVDRNGKEIGRFFVQNRSIIPIEQVPQVFIDALKAGEDQRFDIHNGVDPLGIARAFYLNWKAGETTQGASTITQQLARNAYDLEGERKRLGESGMQRKIVEAFLAMRIEDRYSKKEILEFYLNRIYFGSGYYGIRTASLGYFGKEPSELNALESAAIVGCIKNPTNLSPINNMRGNRNSRNLVINRMAELGMITKREAHELCQTPLVLNPRPLRRGTSHLYERIAEAVGRVMGDDGLAAGGYRIHTTILAEAQNAAQNELEKSLTRAESQAGYTRPKHAEYQRALGGDPQYVQGACLMVRPETGEVLVHVGGRDYAQAPYDFIESGRRPLGTAFFPFLYATALERGISPAQMLEDEPMDNRSVMVSGREGILGEWGMEVSNPVYEREITLRRSFEQSKIAATVRLLDQIGMENLVKQGVAFGFPLDRAELLRRMAVGFEDASLKEAVRAMTVFPQGGQVVDGPLVYLDRIVDSGGKTVYQRRPQPRQKKKVVSSATAWQVHDMLVGNGKHGSARGLYAGLPESFSGAGKGGTTHDFGDCWFLGYNREVSCGVWTGFLNQNGDSIYPGAFSRDLAMPVWKAAMQAALPHFKGAPLEAPEDVVSVPVCAVSGHRPTQFCREYREDPKTGKVRAISTEVREWFRKGNDNLAFCHVHAGADIDDPKMSVQQIDLPALDAVPVRPLSPVLLGDDPYHSEVPAFAAAGASSSKVPRRTNVLDSLDLTDGEKQLMLPAPKRLEIVDE